MSTIQEDFQLVLISTLLFLVFSSSCDAQPFRRCKFDSIYQLGDSISDTGNLIIESSLGAATPCSRLPYGETFFNEPTGRCSNGLLMIDHVALEAGLPFLNPYLKKDSDFSHGVNFAVTGATALSTSFLAAKGVISPVTNSSLNVQLDRMSSFFSSAFHNDTDRAQELKDALFLVGEIGGNDFNFAFFQGKTIEEEKSIVPDVVQIISDAVRRVIQYGARRVVVPGNFPIGCLPIYLTVFKTNNTAAYDEFNCLKGFNDFAEYYNERLQQAIEELRNENPDTVIVYADYYNAFQWLFRNALFLGLDPASLLKACCGAGGEYNYDRARTCGAPGVQACPDPDRLVHWDGIHLTQKASMLIAKWLIQDILPKLQCNA
ncbi:hypothetical protein VitviT2T_020916 [Vitis vinifera]|uniref:GDSL esterase/lipase n=2 Tax=Vitis vinifera TaxID=29760 RepID=A0ABY9D7J5_VITVI|eukprot:XP_002279349.1 PREDICTED: acetylajmalan esterase [Vitis vinifera]